MEVVKSLGNKIRPLEICFQREIGSPNIRNLQKDLGDRGCIKHKTQIEIGKRRSIKHQTQRKIGRKKKIYKRKKPREREIGRSFYKT